MLTVTRHHRIRDHGPWRSKLALIILVIALIPAAGLRTLCTASLTDGIADTDATHAIVGEFNIIPHTLCEDGKAYDGCCRHGEGLPCAPELMANASCCVGDEREVQREAVLVFELKEHRPFRAATIILVHACHPAETGGQCQAESPMVLNYCEGGSCTSAAVGCDDGTLSDADVTCTGSGTCTVLRDVDAAIERAMQAGWDTVTFRVAPVSPTYVRTWPVTALCTYKGDTCAAVTSAPATRLSLVYDAPGAPVLTIHDSCKAGTQCKPGEEWECLDLDGDGTGRCGECTDEPGAPCLDDNGRQGYCCGGQCSTMGPVWTDADSDGRADAGIDPCGESDCTATLICSGGSWSCASTGEGCCTDEGLRSCDDAGTCTSGTPQDCGSDACAAGACRIPCGVGGACPSGKHCVNLESKMVCLTLCSSVDQCDSGESCFDTNANGGPDACGPCAIDGVRCTGIDGTGYCCRDSCVYTNIGDTNNDNRLAVGDLCGETSCSGSPVCTVSDTGPAWICSSEGSSCCMNVGQGICRDRQCQDAVSCGAYACTEGVCASSCDSSDDCASLDSCIDVEGTHVPQTCGDCSDHEGSPCLTSSGGMGLCCAGECRLGEGRGETCGRDCYCTEDLACADGLGVCLTKPGDACEQNGDCASGCCAGGMCFQRGTGLLNDPCGADCECRDGLACGGGRCRRELGASCDGAFDCASGCCVHGSCIGAEEVLGGSPCLADCQCTQGFACHRDDPTDTTGVCLVATSKTCTSHYACVSGCCADGVCVNEGTLPVRDACIETCQCLEGIACLDSICIVPLGGPCAAGNECELGVCVNETCVARGDKGLDDVCALENECADGLTCVNGICLFNIGKLATSSTQCASDCASGGVCIESKSIVHLSLCDDPCACQQGHVCNVIKGVCLRDVGGSCAAHSDCDGGCCADDKCAAAGATEVGKSCTIDCECTSWVCASGKCASARPCATAADCMVELERKLCVDGVCKARCEPEGLRCNGSNVTGFCCAGSCLGLVPGLAESVPSGACGEGPCTGALSCIGATWTCSSVNRTCCTQDWRGTCSFSGVCDAQESCDDLCEEDLAVARACDNGHCVETGRQNCTSDFNFCREGVCSGCLTDPECRQYNTCEATLHIGYACFGGTCNPREQDCRFNSLICKPGGCTGCTTDEECSTLYGPEITCDSLRHRCRSLNCAVDDDCTNLCDENTHIEYLCHDFMCKRGDEVPCTGGKVCALVGCGDCHRDRECVIHYGMDFTCRDGVCRRTCGDGLCEPKRGEDCVRCPVDCVCNAAVLCDPTSMMTDEMGCVADSDADRFPDDQDPDVKNEGEPCLKPKDCHAICRRGEAVTRACIGGVCEVTEYDICHERDQVCVDGACAPCTDDEGCRALYGPIYVCADKLCRRDIDGDGVHDGADGCPRDPLRTEGCEGNETCMTGTRDCRTSSACKCAEGEICDPFRPKADDRGCVAPICGDEVCDRPLERGLTCCTDCDCLRGELCDKRTDVCMAGCGDGTCVPVECGYCADDCSPATCRNDVCNRVIGENAENTPDCNSSVEIHALLRHEVAEAESIELPLQIRNTGNVPTSFTVHFRAENARLGLREVATPVIPPGKAHGFMLNLQLTSGSGPASVEVRAVSDSDPSVNAIQTVVVEQSTFSYFSRALSGSILTELPRNQMVVAIVVGTFLALWALVVVLVLLVKVGTRSRRPKPLTEYPDGNAYDSYYAASNNPSGAGYPSAGYRAGQGQQ